MNPIEERIAKVFQDVGAGSDTLSRDCAERIAAQCNIKGLTPDDVMQGGTPRGIFIIWLHRCMSASSTKTPDIQQDHSYPLLPFSQLVFDAFQQDEKAVKAWTFPILLRAKSEEIDAMRLTAALEQAINNHPIFSMHISEEGKQTYEKGYRTPYLSARVYSEDGYVYLSLTLNRILGDATSFVLFAQNIWRAYRGDPLPQDGYLRYLQQYEEVTRSKTYQEHGVWLAQQYDHPTYPLLPTPDSPQGMLPADSNTSPYVVCLDYADKLPNLFRKERISPNAFFCLATALAIMDFNGTDQAGLTWAYMGRETHEQMSTFGSLHRDIPLTITKTITKTETETETKTETTLLFAQLREQMEQGIIHSDYPFTLSSPAESPWHTAVNVLVQPSLAEAMEGCPAEFEFIPTAGTEESHCMLDIDINLDPLTLTFNYSPKHYTEESIRRFASLIDNNARLLLNPHF